MSEYVIPKLPHSKAISHFADSHGVSESVVWTNGLNVLLHLLDYPFAEQDGYGDRGFSEMIKDRAGYQPADAVEAAGWRVVVDFERNDIRITLQAPAKINADDLRRHGNWLSSLIERLINAPATPVKQFDILGPEELASQLALAWGRRDTYPSEAHIDELCFAQAEANPTKIAVLDHYISLTYAELCRHAEMLAAKLTQLGIGAGETVALFMSRSAGMVVAALAVLRVKGIYVPIDPQYPEERIRYLLDDSGAQYLVRLESDSASDDYEAAMVLELDRIGVLTSVHGCQSNLVSSRAVNTKSDPAYPPAYLMYTSGSTGQPKGVLVAHRGVVRLAYGLDDLSLDASTVMLFAGAVGFDSTVLEMWCPLIHGGCLCVASRDDLLDSDSLRTLLVRHRVNTLFMTPALFALHADSDPTVFKSVREISLGGDRFPVRQVESVARACPGMVFMNGYGPTENSVLSTTCRVTSASLSNEGAISIGRPLGHSSAYVLNKHCRILPDGMIGELYVGGDGLGLGYFQRPELTEAAFVPHPYEPGLHLYRTGDFACVGQDQMLYFHGRRDHQVKIRGHRVELGEIESLLAQYPTVSGAVVVPREDAVGEPILIAYLHVEQHTHIDELRGWLNTKLPSPLVPTRFECLGSFPITPNGKVDRTALAALDYPAILAREISEPQDLDEALPRLAAEILGLPVAKLDVSFNGLGGSSLAAARLARRIETVLQRRCSASMILAAESITALAEELRHAPAPQLGPNAEGASIDGRPASPQQRRLYIEQAKNPKSTAYNLPIVIEFDEIPDLMRLRTSFAQLVKRHPMLSAYFTIEDGVMTQRIARDLSATILVSQDSEISLSDFVQPFDIGSAPLWRAVFTDGECPQLLFDIHHILCDGQALRNLFGDWDRLYDGMVIESPALSYFDYIEWQTRSLSDAQKAQQRSFWLDTLIPLSPAVTLPTDRQRVGARSDQGGHFSFEIGAVRTAALKEFVRGLDVTLFQGLISAYAIWLARATGSRDFVVGVPFLGRQAPGSEQVFGNCVNTVCLRFSFDPDDTFEQLIRRTTSMTLAAAEHQDYSFDELVRELVPAPDYRRHPIFDTMFALQDTGLTGMSALGGSVQWVPAATEAALFDLNLQVESGPQGLFATWGFALDVFDRLTVEDFAGEFLHMLDMMISTPDGSIALCLEDSGIAANLPEIAFSF